MSGIKQDAFCSEWQRQIKKVSQPIWIIKLGGKCLYQHIYMRSLPVSPVFNAPQRPSTIGNLRPAAVAIRPLVKRVLVEGDIFTHLIRVDSALLLVAAVESIIEVIDHIPLRLESFLQLPLEHLLVSLYQFLISHLAFLEIFELSADIKG